MYMLVFVVRRFLNNDMSITQPDSITMSVIALFLVSLFSTLINWPLEKSFSGPFDTLSFCALFLCLYHGGYTGRQIQSIALIMLAGVLTGLTFGLIEYSSGVTSSLSFHSAGVTTQSSIYLGIAIMTAYGFQADDTEDIFLYTALMFISLFLMGVALLYMGSRGSIFAVVTCLLPGTCSQSQSTSFIIISRTCNFCRYLSSYFLINTYPTNINNPEYRERFSVERFKKSDSERLENWNIAIATIATGNNLFWGIGPRNYQAIDPEKIGIDSAFYQRTGKMHHAHNLFLTQWVEQGLIGLLAMLAFFFLVISRLLKSWAYCRENQQQWIWISGAAALVVPVTAGFFNTPFYQEPAMLAMLLMGAMFSQTRKAV